MESSSANDGKLPGNQATFRAPGFWFLPIISYIIFFGAS